MFDGHFLYSNCQQYHYTEKGRKATLLQSLESGDVIIFGSRVHGEYVLDTVFVISKVIHFSRRNNRSTLAEHVPSWYYTVSLDLLVGEHVLYLGATESSPYEGMFSFFPCVQADSVTNGFQRPPVLKSFYAGQSRGYRYKNLPSPSYAWSNLVNDVLAAGLALGVSAKIN